MQKPETLFRKQVTKFLNRLRGVVIFPIQQVAIRGTPDFLLCLRGKFVALELKSAKGTSARLQIYFREKINKSGGIALEVKPENWEEVKTLLTKISQGDEDES